METVEQLAHLALAELVTAETVPALDRHELTAVTTYHLQRAQVYATLAQAAAAREAGRLCSQALMWKFTPPPPEEPS